MVEKIENIETKIDDKFIIDKNGNKSETKQDNKEENSKSKKICKNLFNLPILYL